MASSRAMSGMLIFLSFLLLLCPASPSPDLASIHMHTSTMLSGTCRINAIYSLGDSIADTGNLIREGVKGDFAVIGHLPYGETTFGKATGRCSDGLLMIDYLAKELKVPLLNPYLDKDACFTRGVNFAVAGATALNQSFLEERGIILPYTNSSLDVQLKWFHDHLSSICQSRSRPMSAVCVHRKLRKSLVLVGEIGGNDYNYAFFEGKPMEEVLSLIPYVVQNIARAVKEVIKAGATRIVVPGNFPIGCMPSYLATFNTTDDPSAYDHRKCLTGLNMLSTIHNQELQLALEFLRVEFPRVLIMYGDYYNAFLNLLDKAPILGFDESSLMRACCGGGGEHNFDAEKMCGSPGTTTCEDPKRYISWDGIHLTQEAYKIMAQQLIHGGGYTYPNHN